MRIASLPRLLARTGAAAACCALLAAAGLALAESAKVADFQLVRGVHPIVMVTLDGGEPQAMLLDSGTANTTLPPGSPGVIHQFCFVDGPCISDVEVYNNKTPYTVGRPGYVNGIIGFDLFRRIPMTIDYPARKIRFSGLEKTNGAIAVDYTSDEFGRPFTKTAIAGIDLGPQLIDTGSSFTRVDPRLRQRLGTKFRAVDAEYSFLMSKTEKTELSAPMQVCLGKACRDDVVVQSGSWPAIGGTFFNRFRVSFDTERGQFLIAPGGDTLPPESSAQRYGLQLSQTDGGLILHVRPNSPAAAAGLKAGMRISAIDGTEVASLGYLGLQERLEGGPAVKQLVVDGGPVRLEAR